ncbi:unnamed protein product [Callosobruchus maculatus]|uniref:Uncharacterized protein n=2 Tax=Callosobruchus maculatus TaxID=64391 RepID=A0A653CJW7_CALMS|nr:unnamed protein product [Callosobruchus maculatus]
MTDDKGDKEGSIAVSDSPSDPTTYYSSDAESHTSQPYVIKKKSGGKLPPHLAPIKEKLSTSRMTVYQTAHKHISLEREDTYIEGDLIADTLEDGQEVGPKPTESVVSARSDVTLISEDINIRVSASRLDDIKFKRPFMRKLKKLLHIHPVMTDIEFNDLTERLYKCCLKSTKDLHELHLRRQIGLDILEDLNIRGNRTFLTFSHVIHITWSIMSCMHHFQLRLKSGALPIIFWIRKKEYERCLKSFDNFVRQLDNDLQRVALNSVIVFYKEGKLWEVEFACKEMVIIVMEVYKQPEECIEDMLHTIETSTCFNMFEAKQLTQVLFDILKTMKWRNMSKHLMKRFLAMYKSSIDPMPEDPFNYVPLKMGLDLCIMNIISNFRKKELIQMFALLTQKLSSFHNKEDLIICFGNLASYTAKKFRLKTNRPFSPRGITPYLIQLLEMASPNTLFFVTMRIWLHLLDTHEISPKRLTPRIYFQGCNYDVPRLKCHKGDKQYFKSLRQFFYHISIIACTYARDRRALEECHKQIALTMIQVPTGYTASCYIAVAMALQDYGFQITQENFVRSHHMHAFVISILTFVCHIFAAPVLYDYVHSVLERRAAYAPHLNPPLRPCYIYASHHILWRSPDLFFEDWDVRFGLWKCFKTRKPKPTMLTKPIESNEQ